MATASDIGLNKSENALKVLSKARLIQGLKANGVKNARKQVDNELKNIESTQVRQRIKNAKGRQFKTVGDAGTYQCDVAFLPAFRQMNDGKTSFLLLINVPTRKAYARPLKSGSAAELLKVFEKLLPSLGDPCMSITADNQFASKAFTDFCDAKGITLNTGIAKDDHWGPFGDRLGIADAAVKTIKGLIDKYMDLTDQLDWSNYLPKIMEVYNDSPNRGIAHSKPDDITQHDAETLQIPKRTYNNKLYKDQLVKAGDSVRIYEGTGQFGKGEVRFSRQIYRVKDRDGFRWRVTDGDGKVLRRRFRDYELLKVDTTKLVSFKAGTNKEAAIKLHKHAQRLVRSTGASTSQAYEQAQESADKAKRKQGGLEDNTKRSGRTSNVAGKYAKLAKGN